MPDPRFHTVAGPFTLMELARKTGTEPRPGDRGELFEDVATMDEAGPADVVYVEHKRYMPALARSRAGACILRAELAAEAPPDVALLIAREPQRAFALAAGAFYPSAAAVPGTAPGAIVHPSARLGTGCEIGPGAVIGPGVEIGDDAIIGANVSIDRGVVIGAHGRIGAGTSISHALIGARVTLYPGVRIGQSGFGVIPTAAGHVAIPQLGRVIIHDDVEIGANTTVDRGALGDTVIGEGCFIDNLCQIGHNVRLGRGCIIAAMVGISGSTVVGDFVMMGGQAGLSGHLKIGDRARIAARGGVIQDVPPGASVGGYPAVPMGEFLRQAPTLRRLMKGRGT